MIDLAQENLLTLAQAAKALPGGRVHLSTIFRWATKGVRGVRLETACRGGGRFTSREALARFFAATNSDGPSAAIGPRTAARRTQDIRSAERELERDGI